MRTILVTLAIFATLSLVGASAHDFYHDECWRPGGCHVCCCADVAPSKLDMAWSLYEKGRWLANRHELERGISSIKEAIELLPKEGRFHLTLGLILRDQGRKDEAIAEFGFARRYGFGCVEEEAYWALKDLGVDPSRPATEVAPPPRTEAAPPADEAEVATPAPAPAPSKNGTPAVPKKAVDAGENAPVPPPMSGVSPSPIAPAPTK